MNGSLKTILIISILLAPLSKIFAHSSIAEEGNIPTMRIGVYLGSRSRLWYGMYTEGFLEKKAPNVTFLSRYINKNEFVPLPLDKSKLREMRDNFFGKVRGTEIIDAIESKIVDGGLTGEASFIRAINKDKPIVAVAVLSLEDSSNYKMRRLILKNSANIFKPHDFKGKTFLTRRGGPFDAICLRELFAKMGIDPNKEINYIDEIPENEITNRLESTKIHGALVHHSDINLIEKVKGQDFIKEYEEFDVPHSELSQVILVFHRDYLKNNPDKIRALLMSYIKYVKRKADKTRKNPHSNTTSQIRPLLTWEEMPGIKYVFPFYVDTVSLNKVQDLLIKYGFINQEVEVDTYVDNTIIKGLIEELL